MAETINISITYADVQRLVLHKKAFYKIYLPHGFKLKPMEHIYLNLNIQIITDSDAKFDLLPTLKHFGLSIENNNWTNSNNTETIKICILNKKYLNTFNIKKGQIIVYLLPQSLKPYTKIKTQFKKIYENGNFV